MLGLMEILDFRNFRNLYEKYLHNYFVHVIVKLLLKHICI